MPDVSVDYTEAELRQLQVAAAAAGMSVEDYIHATTVLEGRRRVFVSTALDFHDAHAAAFDEAFPDDAPRRGAGAAA
ncbi:hypothetical protein ACFYYN_35610 [Streptomyces sp. NPDC001902]